MSNNLIVVLVLLLVTPQYHIFHKYYDPLVFILCLTMIDFEWQQNLLFEIPPEYWTYLWVKHDRIAKLLPNIKLGKILSSTDAELKENLRNDEILRVNEIKNLAEEDSLSGETIQQAIKDPDVQIIYQHNRGFGDALISGINAVDTDYFCIFNADVFSKNLKTSLL